MNKPMKIPNVLNKKVHHEAVDLYDPLTKEEIRFSDKINVIYASKGYRKTYHEMKKLLREKDKEIERLKQGYCELKEKCNNGNCDCTNEEYNNMCEANIKLSLKIDELTAESTKWESKFYDEAKKVDKAIEYIRQLEFESEELYDISEIARLEVLDILKGSDNYEN